MLTGIRVEISGEKVVLAATDRFRLAVRELTWSTESADIEAAVLVPAKTLAEAAKAGPDGADVHLSLGAGSAVGKEGSARYSQQRQAQHHQTCWTPSSRSSVSCCPPSTRRSRPSVSRSSPRRSNVWRWWPIAVRRSGWSSPTTCCGLSAGADDVGRAEGGSARRLLG